MIRGYMEPTKSGRQKIQMKLKDALAEKKREESKGSRGATPMTQLIRVDSKSSKSVLRQGSRSISHLRTSRSKDHSVRLNNPNSYSNTKKVKEMKGAKTNKTSNKLML
mmetsp:Transcript_29481/g.44754  ORF Transcript_29481/g.44754 Transcript_29481/m.44754 type:complete len:108 (-) Transcript_29481:2091-2414(-)